MSLLSDIYDVLSASGAVSALVSDRIYPARRPLKAELPSVTYFKVAHPHGETQTTCSISWPHYQFAAWAETQAEAAAVVDVLKPAIRSLGESAIIVAGGDLEDPQAEAYGSWVEAEIHWRET